jgi:hypothetical protein
MPGTFRGAPITAAVEAAAVAIAASPPSSSAWPPSAESAVFVGAIRNTVYVADNGSVVPVGSRVVREPKIRIKTRIGFLRTEAEWNFLKNASHVRRPQTADLAEAAQLSSSRASIKLRPRAVPSTD